MYRTIDLDYKLTNDGAVVFVIYAIPNRPFKAYKNTLTTTASVNDLVTLKARRTPTAYASHLSKVARYGECQYFDTLEDARRWIEE